MISWTPSAINAIFEKQVCTLIVCFSKTLIILVLRQAEVGTFIILVTLQADFLLWHFNVNPFLSTKNVPHQAYCSYLKISKYLSDKQQINVILSTGNTVNVTVFSFTINLFECPLQFKDDRWLLVLYTQHSQIFNRHSR